MAGIPVLSENIDPLIWHSHEMLFGFAAAAVCGFILTAIPNWTGGLPVSGWCLAVLFLLWLVGRLAFLASADIGAVATAVLDLPFLTILALVIRGKSLPVKTGVMRRSFS